MNSQRDNVKRATDLLWAMMDSDEPNLSWDELITLLGVAKDSEGNVSGLELFNACMNVQNNPAVLALPDKERIRAIRSAADALTALRSGQM